MLAAILSIAFIVLVQSELALVQVVMVSRHGIRSPYPPTNGTLNDYSSYTPLVFPNATAWGMTEVEFETQHLSPQGEVLIQLLLCVRCMISSL